MADNDVRIKLSLDGADKVSSGLAGVGDGADQADSKVSSLVKGGLAGAGKALVGFSVAAVAAGTALAVGVVKAYADAEQSVGGIETLFGTSADAMKSYAKDAYKDAGLSANEYMEQATSMSASLIQSVGGDTAKAAELANVALVSMSDNANKMGTDLGSIQNAFAGFAKGNYTMLDNLKLGYGGTQEEMARLLADAEKLPSAMGQKFDISNYGDVVTAIQLVQEEMGIAGTTALEANETISGSVGMLTGSFNNLLVAMGSANNESLGFLEVQEQAANVISSLESVISNVSPVIESIGSSLATLGPQIGTMLEGLVGTVATVIPDIITAGIGIVEGLIAGISSALPGLITALVPALVGLVSMISTQLPLLVDAGMKAVIALGQGIAEALPELIPMAVEMIVGVVDAIITNLPMLLEAALQIVTGLAEGILASLPTLIAALPGIIIGLVEFLVSSIPMIIEAGMQLFLGIIGALPDIIVGIVEAIPLIIDGVITAVLGSIPLLIQSGLDLFIALVGALPEIIVAIVKAIPQIISSIISAVASNIPLIIQSGVELLISLVKNIGPIVKTIVSAIPQIITGIVGAIGSGIGQMVSAGGDLIAGLWNGISQSTGWLLDKIGGWVGGVMDGIKGFFGINSPSKLMEDEVGQWLPAGVGVGVEKNEDDAIEPIKTLGKKMVIEAKHIPKLDMQQAFAGGNNRVRSYSASVAMTPTPLSFTSTQVVSIGDSVAAAISQALTGVSLSADVTSTISQRDMDNMADKVHSAIVDVRREDSRSASLAVQQRTR